MRDKIRSLLRGSAFVIIGTFILYNLKSHLRRFFGSSLSDSGTTHSDLSLENSVDYIESVFGDYKTYGSIQNFHGIVAEIGPGDNFGVALKMLSDGAEHIDLLDRFYSQRDMEQQESIYKALADSDRKIQKIKSFNSSSSIEDTPGLNYIYGEKASANVYFKQKKNHYDYIVSRSVLEHVDDSILALEDMLAALKPGGKLIHKIDLKDHGMFTPEFHDIKYFEVPDFWYRLMTRGSGCPNRILYHQYKAFLERNLPLKSKMYVTQLAGVGDILPHKQWTEIDKKIQKSSCKWIEAYKNRFTSSLKVIDSKDLCPLGVFLIIEK